MPIKAKATLRDLQNTIRDVLIASRQPDDAVCGTPWADVRPEDMALYSRDNDAFMLLGASEPAKTDGAVQALEEGAVLYVGFRAPGQGTCAPSHRRPWRACRGMAVAGR